MANKRGKSIDNTHLSIDQAEKRGFIHRDYIAHCLRWSHVAKYLGEKKRYLESHVLDIGCGKDLPLLRLMYTSRLIPKTGSYTGVDVNDLSAPFSLGSFPYELWGKTDVVNLDFEDQKFDVITCFEVLEHVEPDHAQKILGVIYANLSDQGVAFVSTPSYSSYVGAAANHVNEMTYDAFSVLAHNAGLLCLNTWGTFASIRDYEPALSDSERELFTKLREYYDSNYLATIFAPLFPAYSRNVLWKFALRQDPWKKRHLPEHPDNSSSSLWEDFTKKYNTQYNLGK